MCNFRDPNLIAFYFYELTHFLDWMKNTLLFICSTNILVPSLTINMENCLTPKNSENVRPHYSQSSRENGTPSSGTSPLVSYTEVPPPPSPPPDLGLKTVTQQMQKESCHVRRSLKGWKRLQLIFSLENGESNPKNNSQSENQIEQIYSIQKVLSNNWYMKLEKAEQIPIKAKRWYKRNHVVLETNSI